MNKPWKVPEEHFHEDSGCRYQAQAVEQIAFGDPY